MWSSEMQYRRFCDKKLLIKTSNTITVIGVNYHYYGLWTPLEASNLKWDTIGFPLFLYYNKIYLWYQKYKFQQRQAADHNIQAVTYTKYLQTMTPFSPIGAATDYIFSHVTINKHNKLTFCKNIFF